MQRTRKHLTFANVVSMIALFVALGGVSYAAINLPKNSVGAKQIKKNAVTGKKIKNNAVTTKKVKNGTLVAQDFKAGQIPAGARGATGPAGPAGPAGAAGAAGVARAFARVAADGTLQPDVAGLPSQVKGVDAGDVNKPAAPGLYCFGDLGFDPASAQVSLDGADAVDNIDQVVSVTINRGEPLNGCPATHGQARVRVWDTDLVAGGAEQDPGAANARFYIWFE